MTNDTPRLRIGIIGIVAVSLFGALFARLWYLQVLASPEYQLQATANQQRVIIEPAPRGRILDRNGVVLVDNRLSYVATLDRQRLAALEDAERTDLLTRLVAELVPVEATLTVDELEARVASDRFSPYTPVPVVEDVPESLAIYLTEHRADFADVVQVDARAIRSYPFGRTASHVLGYVGAINDEEFASRRDSPDRYQLTDEIGKSGVERTFEEDLRGTPGTRVLEVDRAGNTVSELSYTPPVPGHDLHLSVDVTIQAIAEQALEEELLNARERRVSRGNDPNVAPAGSVVVESTTDGSIVAMASYPDFDPSTFTDGIDQTEWTALTGEGSYAPFTNRAIAGQYAPGSTFKLITAYAALSSGLRAPADVFHDVGSYRIPNCSGGTCIKYNAGRTPYGNVDLAEAITVSSDAYFYEIGARAWFERDRVGDPIQAAAELFGMGADTGIALSNELSGRVMTPEEYAARHEADPEIFTDGEWQAGDNVNISIGQGEMLTTPMQLANAYVALANGGTLLSPNIALRVTEAGSDVLVRSYAARVIRSVPFDPTWHEALMRGFAGVTGSEEPRGTAYTTFSGFPEGFVVSGKTGTAQVAGKADTAVFVGMGPAPAGQPPPYVAAAFLEESGFGGVAAAPVVRLIFAPIADPSIRPTVGPGGVLSEPLAESADPLAGGDVLD